MRRAILDTDILSEVSKGINEDVRRGADEYLELHPFFSFTSISVYEVLYGLKVKSASVQIKTFLDLIADHEEIVPDVDDYRLASDIRSAMHRSGTEIGRADPIIAACAVRRSCLLVTGNERHYRYIKDAGFDLEMSNWKVRS